MVPANLCPTFKKLYPPFHRFYQPASVLQTLPLVKKYRGWEPCFSLGPSTGNGMIRQSADRSSAFSPQRKHSNRLKTRTVVCGYFFFFYQELNAERRNLKWHRWCYIFTQLHKQVANFPPTKKFDNHQNNFLLIRRFKFVSPKIVSQQYIYDNRAQLFKARLS